MDFATKFLKLMLYAFFPDGFSYFDNDLPRKQCTATHDSRNKLCQGACRWGTFSPSGHADNRTLVSGIGLHETRDFLTFHPLIVTYRRNNVQRLKILAISYARALVGGGPFSPVVMPTTVR